jgi:hypothetical protein
MEALHRMKEQVLSGVCVGTHGEIVSPYIVLHESVAHILTGRGYSTYPQVTWVLQRRS